MVKRSKEKPSNPFFRVGEPILESGLYRVFHKGHRVSHEVTLVRGGPFPHCVICGDDVHFELIHAAPHIDSELAFRVRLYELPHPESLEDKKKEESDVA